MAYWPLDLTYEAESPVSLQVYHQPLTMTPLNRRTLEFKWGEPDDAKIVGVGDDANIVRLVPTIGTSPLLIFPRRSLLCPARSKLKTVLRLPLFIEVGIGRSTDIRKISEIQPPSTSHALYGPVDAGVLCTSIRSEVGVSIDELRDLTAESTSHEEPMRAADGSGDDPDMTVHRDLTRSLSEAELVAFVDVAISNRTGEPREVAKIMVPHELITLYESDDVIRTGQLEMKLLSESEAEIEFGPCPDTDALSIGDLHGRQREADGRKHLFDLHYRNKTGLEYGF